MYMLPWLLPVLITRFEIILSCLVGVIIDGRLFGTLYSIFFRPTFDFRNGRFLSQSARLTTWADLVGKGSYPEGKTCCMSRILISGLWILWKPVVVFGLFMNWLVDWITSSSSFLMSNISLSSFLALSRELCENSFLRPILSYNQQLNYSLHCLSSFLKSIHLVGNDT